MPVIESLSSFYCHVATLGQVTHMWLCIILYQPNGGDAVLLDMNVVADLAVSHCLYTGWDQLCFYVRCAVLLQ